jgi:CRP-like cAMP-binding protein
MAGQLTNDLALLVRRLERRGQIEDSDRDAILALPHGRKSYEPGQYILREAEKPTHCSLLLRGFAYRHKLVADGGRQIVSIHMRGDLIDVQNVLLDISDHNVQSLTPVELALIAREDILGLAFSRPCVGRALWLDSLIDASILREWVTNVGRRDARSRLAHVICEVAIRQELAGLGDKEQFELPMTQEQLADVTGMTAVHVNRTLRTLQQDGLVSRSKRAIAVVDWERLKEAADFTSAYLHLATKAD